jgi:hypothetical protein
MNRQQRRQAMSRTRAALKDSGCRCNVKLIPDPDGRGGWHRHELGCPLDDWLNFCASKGHSRLLAVETPPDCGRPR